MDLKKVAGRLGKIASAVIIGLALPAGTALGQGNDSDEKLAQRVAKIDERFAKAFGELALKSDEEKDLEAAAFFAECHVGMGGKDPKVLALKSSAESEVYAGRAKPGKAVDRSAATQGKLDPFAKEYKPILDFLLGRIDQKKLTEGERTVLYRVVVRHELASRAHEYVRTVKRLNEIRRGMGLKAVLWDYKNSTAFMPMLLIQPMTGEDLKKEEEGPAEEKRAKGWWHWRKIVPEADGSAIMLWGDIGQAVDRVRSLGPARWGLLNPDGRRIWLAGGRAGRSGGGNVQTVYELAAGAYREDVPTPSQRYGSESGKPKEKNDKWVETELTVQVGDRRVPIAHYPFDGETEVPLAYANGEAREEKWVGEGGPKLERSGVPIGLALFGKVKISDVKIELEGAGKKIACFVETTPGSDDEGSRIGPTILAVPEVGLTKATEYRVRVECKLDGSSIKREWKFTTRRK